VTARRGISAVVVAVLVAVSTAGAAQAHTAGSDGSTVPCRGGPRAIPVSVASPAAGGGVRPAEDAVMTPNGRYVAFVTPAALVPGDTNESFDIFVRDVRRGVTTRVSVSSGGRQSNGDSVNPAISANGRYVAFASLATNLVPGDTNGEGLATGQDVFVRDLWTATTTRVNVSTGGDQAFDRNSGSPSISGNGRYVVFETSAGNLVPGDTNGTLDIFERDRWTGTTRRISVRGRGTQADGSSVEAEITPDGRYATFTSEATNLVPGDSNGTWDVFVRDRRTARTTRVSESSRGEQANWPSEYPSISANGRYVTFSSVASNLVPGDANDTNDIFLHDRRTGSTTLESRSSTGEQGNYGHTYPPNPTTSTNGRYITFASAATNLVPGDTNDTSDVFVRDRLRGSTARVSVTDAGAQLDTDSGSPSITADGRAVLFDEYGVYLRCAPR
jgi:Tol biopolymer transport system component